MDPQLKSILTSIAMGLSSAVAAWAASKGVIPASDQSVLANQLVTVGFGAAAAGLTWYKARQQSQKNLIAAVNAGDNGVKVVAITAPAPKVEVPLR